MDFYGVAWRVFAAMYLCLYWVVHVEFDNYIKPSTLLICLDAMPPVGEIAALPGVVGVDELGGPHFRVQFSDAREAMDKIVEASFKNGWQLSELRQEKSSLDTIFAELSKK